MPTVEFLSDPGAIAPALDRVEAALASAGVPRELTLELRLLSEEAVTNVVKYAGARSMTLSIDISDARVTLELRDDGRAFDPLSASPPELDATVAERGLGGLGIHLMRSIADELTYARDGSENVLAFTKKR